MEFKHAAPGMGRILATASGNMILAEYIRETDSYIVIRIIDNNSKKKVFKHEKKTALFTCVNEALDWIKQFHPDREDQDKLESCKVE